MDSDKLRTWKFEGSMFAELWASMWPSLTQERPDILNFAKIKKPAKYQFDIL